jgi:hypothetical protein
LDLWARPNCEIQLNPRKISKAYVWVWLGNGGTNSLILLVKWSGTSLNMEATLTYQVMDERRVWRTTCARLAWAG